MNYDHTLDETELPGNAPTNALGGATPDRLPRDGRYRVNYHHGMNKLNWDQISKIEAIPGYQEVFYYPYPHNYVLIALPQRSDLDGYLASIRKTYAPLNDADGALLDFLDQQITGEEARNIIARWRERRSRGLNLEGVRYAHQLTGLMGKTSLPELIMEEQPGLIDRFVFISPSIQATERINIYTPIEKAVDNLAALLSALGTDENITASFDRIEVAKAGLDSEQDEAFPSLILYPKQNASALDRIKGALQTLAPALLPKQTFAQEWTHNATYSQGFRLYKCYLQLLGQLDHVYDSQRNYAKLRSD
ncbi:hypothetical protein V5T82_16875 [Magnetovibrio sp. PR-2]|uniref:hypothetical protein n=1 Tax=Magnetovibrio sp. PR-2 TaxID=3120356 RepID=UPI002FCDF10D